MRPARKRRVDMLLMVELRMPELLHSERVDLARAVDQLSETGEHPGVERVGGTRRLHRMRVGAWKVLFVRDPDRILLVSIHRGRGC